MTLELTEYLSRAQKDGYVSFSEKNGKIQITYISSNNYRDNFSDPEEQIRAEFYALHIYL